MNAHPAAIGRLGDAQQAAKAQWHDATMIHAQRLRDAASKMIAAIESVVERDASPALFAKLCGDASELLGKLEAQAKGPRYEEEYR